MSINAEALFMGGEATSYTISKSLRFSSTDSSFLSRTPASAGNRKTWTWAGWVKKTSTSDCAIFSAGDNVSATRLLLWFDYSSTIKTDLYGVGAYNSSNAVYRDHSAWYHIVWSFDTTKATAIDRSIIYVNGARIPDSNPRTFTQDSDQAVNAALAHNIGRSTTADVTQANGYLADIHFIDGQALDPTSFGEFDTNGIWQPKQYTGTYGTNGFHLDFADNSAATATTLGKDTSGNGNNWTPNNLSVTAGAGNDSLVDSPTNYGTTDTGVGGELRGNYAVLNPLDNGGLALSNGNLYCQSSSGDVTARATLAMTTGKWYWEVTAADIVDGTGATNNRAVIGIALANTPLPTYIGNTSSSWGYISYSGFKITNGSTASYGSTYSTGNVIGVAFDADAGSLTFYKNNSSQGTAYSGLAAGTYLPAVTCAGVSGALTINFGQRPFAYTAPSGFKALCTANLPAPVITKPSTVMDVKLYTGNGSTQTISGLGFSPDLVWGKVRNGSGGNHMLADIVRGATKRLISNLTNAEDTGSALVSFDSSGFSLDSGSAINQNTDQVVAWCWDAGSSTVTNTQGSITSSVRANPSAGFSIVTYTHPYPGAYTVGHGLNTPPRLIITKGRNFAINWYTYSAELPNTHYLLLNSTGAAANYGAGLWNNTSPTSTVFSVGTDLAGYDYVAYCFAPVAGYSAFGSYTGNGSADGPFVYTGFRPRWVMIKCSTAGGNNFDWFIYDAARDAFNASYRILTANSSGAETVATGGTYTNMYIDILSSGFKVRTNYQSHNNNGSTYIYCAFAESPFSLARAR